MLESVHEFIEKKYNKKFEHIEPNIENEDILESGSCGEYEYGILKNGLYYVFEIVPELFYFFKEV
ncbi:hypothetical protein [Cetobacterium sp.]|uniref:hypothetical protein n=1 Tax=Cetobacterium sp. TaxID=2071632 RepID=UPI003EE4CDF3